MSDIVAFLQNPWFKPGTSDRVIHTYRDDQRYHRKVLSMCMTGRRLMEAFGDLYEQIHWDNTNWRPAYMANGKTDPDYGWMRTVIANQKPKLILCFGNQAKEAYIELGCCYLECEIPYLTCHHPNARFRTQQDLNHFALTVRHKVLALNLLPESSVQLP
jgi:hypothetical protein